MCEAIFDPNALEDKLSELSLQCEDELLWNDPKNAQKLLQERSLIEKKLNGFLNLEKRFNDDTELAEFSYAENDEECLEDIERSLKKLSEEVKILEAECLFSGDADENDCFLEINAGAGGTESNDWAGMLLRMYQRFIERHGFKCETVNSLPGEEVGIKSITLKVLGSKSYGWLRTESGVHRLVRISPFDSNAKRHTSFASVWVYPVIDDSIEIVIEDKDIRIDTYRASGAGGQHVNKTNSAIRITHLPTNIVAQCQDSKSQHRNKTEAMSMLKSRLYELELQEKEKKIAAENDSKTDIGWGHQIRSYVMQPYQLVKDLRTNHEVGNIDSVLDGHLEELILATLASKNKK